MKWRKQRERWEKEEKGRVTPTPRRGRGRGRGRECCAARGMRQVSLPCQPLVDAFAVPCGFYFFSSSCFILPAILCKFYVAATPTLDHMSTSTVGSYFFFSLSWPFATLLI